MDQQNLAALFANPPAAYRPMYFWLWNGVLTREEIRAQLADFAAKGVGGVFVHPMGEHFRLNDFVTGMTPPYLSDEYLALVREAALCAHELGLYLWLYDEGGWPSGNAQGLVVEGQPEFARKRLVVRRMPASQAAELPTETVAVLGLPDLGVPQPIEPRDLAQALTPFREVMVFAMQSDPSFVDVLAPAAVERFITVTHERYAAAVGEFFGNTIPGIFTDETPLGGAAGAVSIPWTSRLLHVLSERLGRDARTYLPLLFSPEAVGPDTHNRFSERERLAARCEYYECVTRLFQGAYWDQITAWCHEHQLLHTGHVGGEDNLPDHLHFGHFFRTAGRLDVPGVDVIWQQLAPGADNFPFPRFATSALHQNPPQTSGPWANLTLTETNAVYGYGFTYERMRWLADYQFQAGIGLYGPMASYYTTAGGRLYGTMSHFGPGMPLWPHYRAFADYVARQCLLARHAPERNAVAVYYPIESLWADPGAGAEAWENLREICGLLLECQVGFDFLDADALQAGNVANGALVVGQARYATVLVPRLAAIPGNALARLADLHEAGIAVTFVDHLPLHAAELNHAPTFTTAVERLVQCEAHVEPFSAVAEAFYERHEAVEPLRLTDPAPDLLLSARQGEGARLYLATNNSAAPLQPAFALQGPAPLVLEVWDLRDGQIVPLLRSDTEPVDFAPLLPAWSSAVFVVRAATAADATVPAESYTPDAASLTAWLATAPESRAGLPAGADVLAEFTEASSVRIAAEAVISADGLSLTPDRAERHPFAHGAAPLLSWQEWGLEGFAGRVEYTFRFPLAEEFAGQSILLDLGAVYWAAEIHVNGRRLADCLWPPHTVDLGAALRGGENVLVVTVANTLADAICAPAVVAEAEARGWLNPYWQRALPMMADRRAGLLGPVRLLLVPATS